MLPEPALQMLFAWQLPHASERTMATLALLPDVETTVAVSSNMLHLLSSSRKLENPFL
jgi:hypothetical protein